MGLERVCVFAGTREGARPEYREAARTLGRELAKRRIGLVYGGAGIGLMGGLADATLEAGGEVVGILPRALQEGEGAHTGLTELRIVESMHARKAMSEEISNAFIALPGGLGSLEELLEISTWHQLGLHAKPVGILSVAGYFDPLADLLDHAVAEDFLDEKYRGFMLFDDTPASLIDRLEACASPA
jgi:uncharacterized protein (TIGR00730 family)